MVGVEPTNTGFHPCVAVSVYNTSFNKVLHNTFYAALPVELHPKLVGSGGIRTHIYGLEGNLVAECVTPNILYIYMVNLVVYGHQAGMRKLCYQDGVLCFV
jgi:hypothetical protein